MPAMSGFTRTDRGCPRGSSAGSLDAIPGQTGDQRRQAGGERRRPARQGGGPGVSAPLKSYQNLNYICPSLKRIVQTGRCSP